VSGGLDIANDHWESWAVIKDPAAYARLCESEKWEALRKMSIEDAIAVGEALLTSEVMDLANFERDSAPVSLAIALGIEPRERRTAKLGEG
jgi:hypothetical protein